jgi:hypothetical protein
MIKIENIISPSPEQWQAVIRGMRNPLNSWSLSDSQIEEDEFYIGEKDLTLMRNLAKAGSDHRKYLRMLPVWMDITAPLYWWKEADTYKVGTVANSCSTMHKITDKEFDLDDFSHEHLVGPSMSILKTTIDTLNYWRNAFKAYNNNEYWWQLIQLLPSSYNQKRTLFLNYEVLWNMYKARNAHKLDEWRDFCFIIENEVPHFKEILLC